MKKALIISLFALIGISNSKGQTFIHEFGKFSSEEFAFKKYEKDPSAEAVVIYDIGDSHFSSGTDGFELIFERRMKIKILTKAGINWANIEIPYYIENNKAENIEELKGNTYNFENGIVKTSVLDPRNTHDEKINDHWMNKKFAMPEAREGSVFEIYYKIKSPYFFNLRGWEFQSKIPVMYSEYSTRMIPFYEYIYILQGTNKFDSSRTYTTSSTTSPFHGVVYDDTVYSFVLKDIPAFKDESYITSAEDYLIKIDFQLAAVHQMNGSVIPIMSTWEKLNEELIDDFTFGKYMNNCKKKGKDMIDSMKIETKSLKEKTQKIENFVKTNFNWNGYSSKFASQNIKEFLTKKVGNSADINLLLAGLLNYAGVEAYPVVISTRDHGKFKTDYPFQHFFNYVIVSAKLDSSIILLDATEPNSNFGEIPARCINEKGLLVVKNKVEWVNLRSKHVSSENYYIDMSLNQEKDSIRHDCRLVTSGFEAIDWRDKFTSSYSNLKSKIFGSNSSKDTLISRNLKQVNEPFEIKFVSKEATEKIENKIIISPFSSFPLSKNPLIQPVRNYPVDMIYRKSTNFQTTLTIPQGYKLLSKPFDMIVNNSMVRILFITEIIDEKHIRITGAYEFKKDTYEAVEYSEIKKYFKMIVDKFGEKIILDKEA